VQAFVNFAWKKRVFYRSERLFAASMLVNGNANNASENPMAQGSVR